MENAQEQYQSYHSMSSTISGGLEQLSEICSKVGLKDKADSLKESRERLMSHTFSVGILGEFKRGKSTVINALLGKEIMPADILPCSATMNRVSYALEPDVQLNLTDGSTEHIAINELVQYVTKLDADCSARAEKVEEAIVFYPCPFCQNGVDIVDTPGLNDDERMDRITEEIIPKLDAVIMVLVPDNPFSLSEADFVRNKLMCSDIGRLVFLVNKIDTIRPKDRQRSVDGIRHKIEKTVLERTGEVYGTDSEQYRSVKMKLADIRIYPVSAMQALEAREENDEEELQKSGMPTFEKALGRMLTEERGVLELTGPATKLVSVGSEVGNTIALMKSSLQTDEESFKEVQKKALADIEELKTKKEEEKILLRNKAEKLRIELGQQAELCYQDIEQETSIIIENMTPPDAKKELNKEGKEKLIGETIEKIQKKIDDVLSIHAEKLSSRLNDIIKEESSDIAVNLIQTSTVNVNKHFNSISVERKNSNPLDNPAGSVVIDVVTDYVPYLMGSTLPLWGIGGLLEGYKTAGVKGAAVGGAGGFLISFAALTGLMSVGVVGLPLMALGAVAGTFGGKTLVKTVFKGDTVNKQMSDLKKVLHEEVAKSITQMRVSRELENWIQGEVTSQFNSLLANMEAGCDTIIRETEQKISDIKRNVTASETERKNEMNRLNSLEADVVGLMEEIKPIYEKIIHCMA